MSQNGLCPSYGAKAFGNQAIKNLYDEIGCFGVLLLLAGKDWGTREWRERSMRLIMAEVRQVWPILIPTERLHEQNWFSKNQSKFHADKPDKTAGEIQTG